MRRSTAVIGAGVAPVMGAFVQFARAGGTPLPLAPTRRLVVSGFHRYVRNPTGARCLPGGLACTPGCPLSNPYRACTGAKGPDSSDLCL